MIKCLRLCKDLFSAVKNEKWDLANELVDELQAVLRTYKEAC